MTTAKMTANDIRKKFLNFFLSKDHRVIPSDSLVPKNDPTVLFTTAGMQQFKKQFLGQLEGFTRAATSQKCLRTDDLKDVGRTAFHHTFFEMLGNFSFGDYFKKEAIVWAWEFLTVEIGLAPEKLWVSVYHDDQEAEDIWINDIQIDPKKLVRLGDKSNFWPSEAKNKGPNGPCGPCSEIFYDYGEETGCRSPNCNPDCSCGRFSEIWNLVFTQFNRQDKGALEALPAKNIDTGMGLERLAAIVQGKKTNFEIDLFEPIFDIIHQQEKATFISLSKQEKSIIADHARAIVFGIADGVIPSNEGRGYVIKKLIVDVADLILSKGADSFVNQIVPAVVQAMKEPYEDLIQKQENIMTWVQKTENAYKKVRRERIPELKKEIDNHRDPEHLAKVFFKYRDTHGLTFAAIQDTAKTMRLSDVEIQNSLQKAERLMDQQREKSRLASKMTGDVFEANQSNLNIPQTIFLGYECEETKSQILKIFKDDQEVSQAKKGDHVKIVLDQTPFYAESGGQIGDAGWFKDAHVDIEIHQTQKVSDLFIHSGVVKQGIIAEGQTLTAIIDHARRLAIMRNHTATHLLQAALRQILGSHVQQQGSLVCAEYLRFDFTHPKALSNEEIIRIEDAVNHAIWTCQDVIKKEMPLEQAQKQGALAFFAEKYHSTVRVVTVDGFSQELCGGTHLENTGCVGLFRIISEAAVAQGIRRVEAITGEASLRLVHEHQEILRKIAQTLKAPASEIIMRIEDQQKRMKELEKQVQEARIERIKMSLDEIIKKTKTIKTVKLLINLFDDVHCETLKVISDLIREKVKSIILVLGATQNDSAAIVVSVTQDLVAQGIDANEIIKQIAPIIHGSGGGRPHLAQAGSQEIKNLSLALTEAENIIKGKL